MVKIIKRKSEFGFKQGKTKRGNSRANDDQFNYLCNKCNRFFSSTQSLKRHMQLHTGHYQFYCDNCRKGFLVKRDYNEHMRAHQGLKYHCDYCSKPFSTQMRLRYHLSMHTGQYRFRCDLCDRGFNEKPVF